MTSTCLKKRLERQPLNLVARLFSTKTLRLLARDSISPEIIDLYLQLEIDPCFGKKTKLQDIYFAALDVLSKNERNEYVFKNAIAEKLLYGKHSPRTAALFFEFRAADSKLDALLLNGTSHAFEIKTSRDELRRLPTQISSYQKIFKNVWLITVPKHLDSAISLLPNEVGIKILSKRNRLESIRDVKETVDFLDPNIILASLRKSEYATIARNAGRPVDDLPNTRQYDAAESVFRDADVNWLHDSMVEQLKHRFSKVNRNLAINIPKPLAAAALSMNLTTLDAQRLLNNLQKSAFNMLRER